jgi:predicted nucleic acid-binding protein
MQRVLSNAGPLIVLGKLNRLDLLPTLYERVEITQAVYDEVVTQGQVRGMPDALTVRLFWRHEGWPVVDVPLAVLKAYVPPVILDPGEIEVLALAQTLDDPLVLLDDEVARSEARRLKLRVRGTLGILAQAYRGGLLSLPQIELLVNEIAARPDIWIAARLCEQVLASLGRPD